MKRFGFFIPVFIAAVLICCPAVSALDVVSTTSVLWEPVQSIGGEKVTSIYVADPTICPHLQGDIINNRIQMNRDFIAGADLFVAHNSSVDKQYVIPPLNDFMEANDYGSINWVTLKNPDMTWNTPENARLLAEEVKGWLLSADPDNASYYEDNYEKYLENIDTADISAEEAELISGQDVIVMIWQKEPAQKWLGLNIVDVYAPEFVQNGELTAAKLVDRIQENPEKYKNVRYVIENMQSGELGKGIEEALNDIGINAERVIFTNFPKSISGVDTIPDVLIYNKGLVTAKEASPEPQETKGTVTTEMPTQKSPLEPFMILSGILGAALVFIRK
ncbi:MAG: zinc ABC transporter substrate-binding protein [Methanomicrobiaceae archaeon]|nr:zinc ABC transporter substrate-binding protein [Methanomicrobiaceae archaeon]